MSSIIKNKSKSARQRRNAKNTPMTKLEMFQKMLADQKIIREAIQNHTPLKDLEKTHGFKFATLPDPKD